jgi:hypothetical protein
MAALMTDVCASEQNATVTPEELDAVEVDQTNTDKDRPVIRPAVN